MADELAGNADTPSPKKGGGKRILILLALTVFFALPILALAVGIGIIPRGGSFNPLKAASTALAADVECLLKFPIDASADDKLIGAVFDQYILGIAPKSPMITEFSGSKDLGLGEAISKSGRSAGVNPTVIVAQARKESKFATQGVADSKPELHNPFGRKRNANDFVKFDSYREAISEHGPYIKRRYIDQENAKTVLDMMNIYAPASDGNDPAGYTRDISTWSAEMVQLAKTNFQNALGAGVCPLPSAQPKV